MLIKKVESKQLNTLNITLNWHNTRTTGHKKMNLEVLPHDVSEYIQRNNLMTIDQSSVFIIYQETPCMLTLDNVHYS